MGYYHQSLQVLDFLMACNIIAICGNHEAYLLNRLTCSSEAQHLLFIDDLKKNISPKHIEWLSRLPLSWDTMENNRHIAAFHGSPWNPLQEYIYPDSKKIDSFANFPWDYILLGHTHYPMLKKVGKRVIINPGSCGQPRDGDPRASAAILDTGSGQIDFLKEDYDIAKFVQDARKHGVPPESLKFFAGREP